MSFIKEQKSLIWLPLGTRPRKKYPPIEMQYFNSLSGTYHNSMSNSKIIRRTDTLPSLQAFVYPGS